MASDLARTLAPALAVAALLLPGASCTTPSCGPGTKQVQNASGDVQCVAADAPAGAVECDVDAGMVEIVAGKCVSKVTCDPTSTTYDPVTGTCKGTGAKTCACGTPAADKFCVAGDLYEFVQNAKLAPGQQMVRVAAFEPTSFLANPAAATPLGEVTTDQGCYVLDNLAVPATGLVAIGVTDPAGAATPSLALAGVGTAVLPGKPFVLDAFVLARATVGAWSAGAGMNLGQTGGYIGLYSRSAVPLDGRNLNESSGFVSGVTMKALKTPGLQVKYLSDRGTVDGSLTATNAIGAALAIPPATLDYFTGLGGTCTSGACKWETHPGGSTAGVFFFDRLHDCTSTPGAPSCQ